MLEWVSLPISQIQMDSGPCGRDWETESLTTPDPVKVLLSMAWHSTGRELNRTSDQKDQI